MIGNHRIESELKMNSTEMSKASSNGTEKLLNVQLGSIIVADLDNRPILFTRFGYILEKSHIDGCTLIRIASGNKIMGDLPSLDIETVWVKATRYVNRKKQCSINISENEWDEAKEILKDYIGYISGRLARRVLVQDIWKIPELDFVELGLRYPDEIVTLMHYAVLEDIVENRYIVYEWSSIKKHYAHHVNLNIGDGGIFENDASQILIAHNIRYINSLRYSTIYKLKNLVPEHDYNNFPKQINAAYREDKARRRDKRYRIYPMLLGFVLLVIMLFMNYTLKYTLLKNYDATVTMITLLGLWVATVLFILFSALRAVYRRKTKRPTYKYFIKPMVVAVMIFGTVSLVSLLSTTVFYERYDGYDDNFYYRNIGDNEIAIAGSVIDGEWRAEIPQYIDGKEVTEIDLFAFFGDSFISFELPQSVDTIDYGAFYNCRNLKYLNMESTDLQFINAYAFYGCKNLKYVALPNSIEELGQKAFYGCSSIIYADIESVPLLGVNIGNAAFANCDSLKSTNILEYGKNIGNSVFKNCVSLEKVTISDYVNSLGRRVFKGCDSLTDVDIPYIGSNSQTLKNAQYLFGTDCNVKRIHLTNTATVKDSAFKGLKSLQSVIFDDEIKVIGKDAFRNCKSLVYIELNGVDEIKASAFRGCESLNIDELPISVTKIGKNAFRGCSSIKSLVIKGNITELGDGAFRDCNGCSMFWFVNGTALETVSKDAFRGCASLEYTNLTESVTAISERAFMGCTSLESLEIGHTVTSIGRHAFKNCDSLRSVELPFIGADRDHVKKFSYLFGSNSNVKNVVLTEGSVINAKMFKGVKSLEKIEFDEIITEIEAKSFKGCTALQYIDLEGVATIGDSAFRGCAQLIIKEIPDSVESIGKFAFRDCSSITQLHIYGAVNQLGQGAFWDCTNCTTITFSDMVELSTLPVNTFRGCKKLIYTNLPELVSNIGNYAFRGCSSLQKIVINDDIKSIGKQVFSNCDSLTYIEVPFVGKNRQDLRKFSYLIGKNSNIAEVVVTDGDTIYAKMFKGFTSLKRVKFIKEVDVIEEEAFRDCSSLETVLVSGVNTIKDSAFRGCSSLSIYELPESVVSIGKFAFRGCNGIESLDIKGKIAYLGKGAFMDCKGAYQITFANTAGLNALPERVFDGCASLKQFYISGDIDEIGAAAFKNCSSLTTIDIPDVNKIGRNAFSGCTSLVSAKVPFVGPNSYTQKKLTYLFKNSPLKYVEIETMTNIKYKAFRNFDTLTEIKINQKVERIGARAFENCESLVKIDIEGVESIGARAFHNCSKLSELGDFYKLRRIGNYAFSGCNSLDSFVVPENITRIKRNLFADSGFTEIILSPKTKVIERKAFKDCKRLKSISIPSSVTAIKRSAFEGCSSLTIIDLSNTKINKINDSVFKNCTSLVTVVLSEYTTVIDKEAFEFCYDLTYIELSNIREIGKKAFNNCNSLTELNLTNAETIGKKAFALCNSAETVTFSNKLREIGRSAFEYCEAFTEITIPDSVKKIGRHAFDGCKRIEKMTIPFLGYTRNVNCRLRYITDSSSVKVVVITDAKKIAYRAFYSTYVMEVRLNKDVKKIGDEAFSNCRKLEMIYLSENQRGILSETEITNAEIVYY